VIARFTKVVPHNLADKRVFNFARMNIHKEKSQRRAHMLQAKAN
jgi:hypothetical protein